MTNVLQRLNDRGLVSVPKAMMANTIFLVPFIVIYAIHFSLYLFQQTGSVAYGAEGHPVILMCMEFISHV